LAAFGKLRSPFWWFGVGGMTATLTWALSHPLYSRLLRGLARPLSSRRAFPSLRRVLGAIGAVAVILAIALYMLGPLALGDRIVSHDHTQHYANTAELAALLARGAVFGWSNGAVAGYPVSYLYPLGAELWVLLFALGPLDLGQAYAVAVFAFFALSGYSVFRLGRSYVGFAAGLLAAVLYMTDLGGFRYGGWRFAIQWGVWPQNLSVAFMVLALSFLPAAAQRTSYRPVALFALFAGAALLTHPTALIALALTLPLYFAALWFSGARTAAPRAAARVFLATAAALAVGLYWLLPFIGSTSHRIPTAGAGKSSYEFGADLVSGKLYPNLWLFVAVFGVIGVIAALRSQNPRRLVLALVVLALWCGFSLSVIGEFNLAELIISLKSLQYERMAILLKPFLFVLAAAAMVEAVRAVGRARATLERMLRRRLLLAFAAGTLLAPVGAGFLDEYRERYMNHDLELESSRPLRAERAQLAAYAEQHFVRDAFFRVAVVGENEHDHSLCDLGVGLGLPIYKQGFTPAAAYRYNMGSIAGEVLRAASVRYVVSVRELTDAHFRELTAFGALRVYEFTGFDGKRFDVTGTGDVEVVRFEDEHIELLAPPGSSGSLRLRVSGFTRWRATRNGVTIPIAENRVGDDPATGFITVPLEPGHYRFDFRASALDWMGRVLGVVGVLSLGLLFASAYGAALRRHLDSVVRTLTVFFGALARPTQVAVASAFVLFPVAAWALSARTPVLPDLEWHTRVKARSVTFDAVDALEYARVRYEVAGRPHRCRAAFDRHACIPEREREPDLEAVRVRPVVVGRFIDIMPSKQARLEIRYASASAADGLVGSVWIPPLVTGQARFELRFAGKLVYEQMVDRPEQRYFFVLPAEELGGRAGELTIVVETDERGPDQLRLVLQGVRGSFPERTAAP
jgi:hypothetical protein